jgi:ferrous iron transport protein A
MIFMPLTLYPSGQAVCIKKIGGQDNTRKFLCSLGFIPGEYVTVISENSGNMIVNIKDCRIALGKDLAKRIVV